MLSKTYLDSKHFFRGCPQVLIRNLLESLEHTVFPKLVRTVKTEVLVNDDVTVSDLFFLFFFIFLFFIFIPPIPS